LAALLATGRTARDEVFVSGERVLVVSQEGARLQAPGRRTADTGASVATLADHTDLTVLGDELRTTKTLAAALRSQTHEHANRIHTLVSLMEMGRTPEALAFATEDLAVSQQLADDVVAAVSEPVLSALLMGKSAQAHERGVTLRISAGGGSVPDSFAAHDLVTIVGNLIDNALDAAGEGSADGPGGPGGSGGKWVAVDITARADALAITVSDSGNGRQSPGLERMTELGFSSKQPGAAGRGIGLALVRQSVARLGGTLTLAPAGGTEDGGTDDDGASPAAAGRPAGDRPAGASFAVVLPFGPEAGSHAG
ncbi:MAG: sensor histidine kinase, partial [Actinomycetales bacterium]